MGVKFFALLPSIVKRQVGANRDFAAFGKGFPVGATAFKGIVKDWCHKTISHTYCRMSNGIEMKLIVKWSLFKMAKVPV
jgi:hypothetical protein